MKIYKIILNSFFILLLSAPTAFAIEKWEKIADDFYVDVNSIEKQNGDYVSGYFKQTNINKRNKGRKISYTKIWTGAFCDTKMQDGARKIEYPIYWHYNSKNKLIAEDNIHAFWKKHYPNGHLGIMHVKDDDFGELYFNTLCDF